MTNPLFEDTEFQYLQIIKILFMTTHLTFNVLFCFLIFNMYFCYLLHLTCLVSLSKIQINVLSTYMEQ